MPKRWVLLSPPGLVGSVWDKAQGMGAAGRDQIPGINAPAPGQLAAARVTLPNPHVCTALLRAVQLWTLTREALRLTVA